MNKLFLHRLALISLIILVISVTGCKKVEDENVAINKSEQSGEEKTLPEADEIMKAFYDMLNGKEKAAKIELFVNNSISNLDEKNADTMVIDYEGYLIQDLNILLKQYEIANSNPELLEIFDLGVRDNISNVKEVELKELLIRTLDNGYLILKGGGYIYPEIDYSILLKYKEYISKEVVEYLEMVNLETKDRFTYGEKIEIPIKNLLNRALISEKYLLSNKKSRLLNKTYDLYVKYINGIILGTGNPYVFANEGSSVIREDILNEYKTFIKDNEDSRTAELLRNYVTILENNKNEMDAPEVLEFYDNVDSIIKDKFIELDI